MSRKSKGSKIKPHLQLVDGVNHLICANDKKGKLKFSLLWNMETTQFFLAIIVPTNCSVIVSSFPIPKESAKELYESFYRFVELENLPEDCSKILK